MMRAFHEACKTLQFTCKGFHKRQPALRGRVGRYDFMSGPFSRDKKRSCSVLVTALVCEEELHAVLLSKQAVLGGISIPTAVTPPPTLRIPYILSH